MCKSRLGVGLFLEILKLGRGVGDGVGKWKSMRGLTVQATTE